MICTGATPPVLETPLTWFTTYQDWMLAMTYAACVIWNMPTHTLDAFNPYQAQ
jgi:hypothetical protein